MQPRLDGTTPKGLTVNCSQSRWTWEGASKRTGWKTAPPHPLQKTEVYSLQRVKESARYGMCVHGRGGGAPFQKGGSCVTVYTQSLRHPTPVPSQPPQC